MPIINLRKYYYPTIQKDAFVEVSGEVAEALEEGLRIERRQEKKKLYHKVFSMDTNDWTQLHISVYAQSPEDVLLQAEDHAEQERNLSRMTEAFSHLNPTQARRIRARYMGGKKLREIGESEGDRRIRGRSLRPLRHPAYAALFHSAKVAESAEGGSYQWIKKRFF